MRLLRGLFMKATIGAKIRGVLEKYPEVRRMRAKLKAVGYLVNRGGRHEAEWHTQHSDTDTCLTLWKLDHIDSYRTHMDMFHMKALSEYKYEPPMEIPNGGKGFTEPLGADVKLVFKDGKFEVAP